MRQNCLKEVGERDDISYSKLNIFKCFKTSSNLDCIFYDQFLLVVEQKIKHKEA